MIECWDYSAYAKTYHKGIWTIKKSEAFAEMVIWLKQNVESEETKMPRSIKDQKFKIGDSVYVPMEHTFDIGKFTIKDIRLGIEKLGEPFYYDMTNGYMGQYPVFATYQEAEEELRSYFENHLLKIRKRFENSLDFICTND